MPWKNLDVYLRNSYPFLHADRIVTPTLFMCGELDFNVPLLNSEQMYQAVRSVGVETQLVIYPGQYHSVQHAELSAGPAAAADRVVWEASGRAVEGQQAHARGPCGSALARLEAARFVRLMRPLTRQSFARLSMLVRSDPAHADRGRDRGRSSAR